MNNSDFNDFNDWQENGADDNNPSNPHGKGFFYYGHFNDKFKHLWNQMHSNQDYTDSMKEYLNVNDILKEWSKQLSQKAEETNFKKQPKRGSGKQTTFSQDEYLKLIEIRGYLAITEQFAHVKALDKVINQIKILPTKEKP